MTFLYYFPGLNGKPTAEQIAAAGLSYALGDGARVTYCGCRGGPDDGSGQVVAAGQAEVGYYPEKQRWQKIPGQNVFVGMDKEKPPGPDDLIRRDALDGHPVELGDGQLWSIPVARAHAAIGPCASAP